VANLRNKKVLITSGPTWVPIDEVRVISNRSTGRMGQALTKAFAKAGAKVTLLAGPWTEAFNSKNVAVKKFYFYDELVKLIQSELRTKFDIVVHAAAVSDYKLNKAYRGKLSSSLPKINLVLVPTQKIINKIRKQAPKATLIGFKLEPTANLSTLRKKGVGLAKQAKCDLVVANSLNGNKYQGYVIDRKGEILGSANSRESLSEKLVKILKD
jgi:phosphopantothenoylcysteine decarboxylase/phosphopantothenate--cysteine ligase